MKSVFFTYVTFLTFLLANCCHDQMSDLDSCIKSYLIAPNDTIFNYCDNCNSGIDCEEVVIPNIIRYNYSYPVYNPNSTTQMAYFRRDNTLNAIGEEIWVIDFCSGEQKKVANNGLYSLDWSTKGWLIYTGDDQNIWKIMSNGDSLTQLTFEGDYNRFPKWNPDGVTYFSNREKNGNSSYFISDKFGEHLDTIPELLAAGAWSWVDYERICFVTATGNSPTVQTIKIYNIKTKEVTVLHDLRITNTSDSLIVETASLGDGKHIIWCGYGLIGKTNIENGSFSIIEKRQPNTRFEGIAISPDKEHITMNMKYISNQVTPCYYVAKHKFRRIDTNGGEDLDILIPE